LFALRDWRPAEVALYGKFLWLFPLSIYSILYRYGEQRFSTFLFDSPNPYQPVDAEDNPDIVTRRMITQSRYLTVQHTAGCDAFETGRVVGWVTASS